MQARRSIPEPATRSFTVRETTTSPGLAVAMIRAPACTHEFTLASVNSGAHFDPELAHDERDRERTTHRPRRSDVRSLENFSGLDSMFPRENPGKPCPW